jgi:hypothetical protein
MALHLLTTNDLIVIRYSGADTQINDAENVLWYQYQAGLTPTPGGMTIRDWATAASNFWGAFWSPFQSTEWSWKEIALSLVASLTPVAPDRYKVVASDRWAAFGSIAGGVAGVALPAYCAYSVLKVTSAPGRGRQGHVRIPGLPSANIDDNLVLSLPLAAINLALAGPNPMTIPILGGFTDTLTPVVMNGKLVNTNPGHPPIFYADFVDAWRCSQLVGSQITRKLGRRRS